MKMLLYIFVGLLLVIFLYFVGLSISSRKPQDLGVINNQLQACPATPNCVSSERQDTSRYIEPLKISALVDDDWRDARNMIIELGGHIVTEREGYLHAHYVTPLFRYIDDVELRLDKNKQIIHIRSASRVGRSDFGANRTRVEKIRTAFLKETEIHAP